MVADKCKYLRINQTIDVIGDSMTFKSKIQDITEEYIEITYPSAQGKYFITHKGSIIEYYTTTDEGIVKISSMVLGRKTEFYGTVLLISLPQKVEYTQRREYFRYKTSRPVKYSVLQASGTYATIDDVPPKYFLNMRETNLIDISGGGAKFVCKDKVSTGDNVLISINTYKGIMTLLCFVVRVEDKGLGNYIVAVKFEGLKEMDRDKLIYSINRWIIEDRRCKEE